MWVIFERMVQSLTSFPSKYHNLCAEEQHWQSKVLYYCFFSFILCKKTFQAFWVYTLISCSGIVGHFWENCTVSNLVFPQNIIMCVLRSSMDAFMQKDIPDTLSLQTDQLFRKCGSLLRELYNQLGGKCGPFWRENSITSLLVFAQDINLCPEMCLIFLLYHFTFWCFSYIALSLDVVFLRFSMWNFWAGPDHQNH